MNWAYVDTSCMAAITFGGPGWELIAAGLEGCERLFSSNLLEAELRAAVARERLTGSVDDHLATLTWVFPERSLSAECQRALECGLLRGADLWHVACALYLATDPRELTFASLDVRQRGVAMALGFPVFPA